MRSLQRISQESVNSVKIPTFCYEIIRISIIQSWYALTKDAPNTTLKFYMNIGCGAQYQTVPRVVLSVVGTRIPDQNPGSGGLNPH